jgi:Fur family transcriptional regulator, ferric uptake regulator
MALQAAGLRVTKARIAVMSYLRSQQHPVSHSKLVEALAPQGFDRATLFRNLKDLAQASLVLRDHYGDTTWRYQLMNRQESDHSHCDHAPHEPCDDEPDKALANTHQHPHFVCSTCKSVQCLPVSVNLADLFPQDPAGIATVTEVVLRGLCATCR